VNSIKEKSVYVLIYLPIIIYIYFLYFYSLNKPIGDDFDSVLMFLNNYVDMNSIKDKFLYLFYPHNEYKLVFSNIIQIIILKLTGSINFVYMIFIGFFGESILLYFIFKYFKEFNLSLIYFIPIPFLLFNLVQYNLSLWPMASMQSYYQFLFAFLSLYYLHKNKIVFFYLFVVMSMFQGGMWVSLSVVIIGKFLIDKSYRRLLFLLLLIFFIFIFMEYTGMNKPGHDIIQNALQLVKVFKFSIGLIGSIFNVYSYAALFATVIIISLVYIIKAWKFEVLKNSLAFNMISIFLVAIPAVAINRVHTGVEASLSSRYSLISIFLIIFIYLFLLKNINKKYLKRIFYFICFLSISLYVYNFKYVEKIKQRYAYVHSNTYPAFNKTLGSKILKNSFKKNIFKLKEKKLGIFRCIDSRLVNLDEYKIIDSQHIIHSSYKKDAIYKKVYNFKNILLFGSYIKGDSTLAKIEFRIHKNQSFLILTGPRTNHQKIQVYNSKNQILDSQNLIVSKNSLMIYSFNLKKLNNNDLKVVISDNGSNWGEWSSVGFIKDFNDEKNK